jgi:hypothetical protein
MSFWQFAGIASLSLATSVQAVVSSTGFTVSLTDIDYFLPPKPVASIALNDDTKTSFEDGPFLAVTIVKDAGAIDVASLSASYADRDDVWQPGFLEGVFYFI